MSRPEKHIDWAKKDVQYHFWDDKGLKIRTCPECLASEAQRPLDGEWVTYFTDECALKYIEYLIENDYKSPPLCKNCNPWASND